MPGGTIWLEDPAEIVRGRDTLRIEWTDDANMHGNTFEINTLNDGKVKHVYKHLPTVMAHELGHPAGGDDLERYDRDCDDQHEGTLMCVDEDFETNLGVSLLDAMNARDAHRR